MGKGSIGLKNKSIECKKDTEKEQWNGKVFDRNPQTVSLDVKSFQRRILSSRS